jgi:hypothetical protein
MTYDYKLNKNQFSVNDSKITGKKVLINGHLEPVEDYELLLKINEGGFEPVQLDEIIDLKRPGIEGFFAKPYKKLVILIDDKEFEVEECFLTPNEIIKEASIDNSSYYLKQLKGEIEIGYENDPNHKIAIRHRAKFVTCKKDTKQVTIKVNTKDHDVERGDITYATVVTFAFPDFPQHPERTYSVTYKKGHNSKPEGILPPNGTVKVKDKMMFTVKHTGQS